MARTVDVRKFVVSGTGLWVALGWLGFIVIALLGTLFTYGILPIVWLITTFTVAKKARALLHGSAVKVGPRQFPDIHKLATEISQSFGLQEHPDIYILEDNSQNAFALKHGRKKFVILIDDVVYGAMATGNMGVLAFILAHEIAHHALGHSGLFRRMISSSMRPLSRLDELSCDSAANDYVQDGAASRDALALLLIGPQLYKHVDRAALDAQAREVIADKQTKKAEKMMTHPLLLTRYGRLLGTMPRIPVAKPLPQVAEGSAMIEPRIPVVEPKKPAEYN